MLGEILAFDRSLRRIDPDNGHLHVDMTPITKANVCGYFGWEIPDSEALGLAQDKMYNLLRDPEELAKAAFTFNNLQLLHKHLRVHSTEPEIVSTVGTIGSDCRFEAPFVMGSIAVWDQKAIDLIQANKQRELSASYYYKADMTPGSYNGERYDGVMRNIRGNHVALVTDGRAGSDVLVADANPLPSFEESAQGAYDARAHHAACMVAHQANKDENSAAAAQAHMRAASSYGNAIEHYEADRPNSASKAFRVGKQSGLSARAIEHRFGLTTRAKTPYHQSMGGKFITALKAKQENSDMPKQTKPALVKAHIEKWLKPRLAADKAIDVASITQGLTSRNWDRARIVIADRLAVATKGRLAFDASMEDIHSLLESADKIIQGGDGGEMDAGGVEGENTDMSGASAAEGAEGAGDPDAGAEGEGEAENDINDQVMNFLADKLSDEDMQALQMLIESASAEEDGMAEAEGADAGGVPGEEGGEPKPEGEEGAEKPEAPPAKAEGGKEMPPKKDDKEGEEEGKKKPATDADRPMGGPRRPGMDWMRGKPAKDRKAAMDSKDIKLAVDQAVARSEAKNRGIREAEKTVRPWVGELNMPAFDSADHVYKIALDTLGVKVDKDAHPSAFKHILMAQPLPGQGSKQPSAIAMDAAANDSYEKMFPNAGRIQH